ncbi:MAG: hypothetical protein IPN53_12290 [Comamonadaceae bacterium]|nr:hypothetical protein [Comamonadaceae bacterium]
MSYESFQKEIALYRLAEICQPFEYEFARAAFDGDMEAACQLSFRLNNDKRGAVAVAMWRAKVPANAFREYLLPVWDHDHRHLIEAAKTRRTLAYMFRYAAFPMPAELPDVVTVWRGSSALTFNEARTGHAWTTDRDVACWFAMRFAEHNGSPLVLTADIAKRDIALFTNERSESEAVLMRPPAARIDGDVSDWTECYQRKVNAMKIAKEPGKLRVVAG